MVNYCNQTVMIVDYNHTFTLYTKGLSMLPRYENKLNEIRLQLSNLTASIIRANEATLNAFENNQDDLYDSARGISQKYSNPMPTLSTVKSLKRLLCMALKPMNSVFLSLF